MTVKKLTLPEFLTLYAIKPCGAGDNGAQSLPRCRGFKTAKGSDIDNPLKDIRKIGRVLREADYAKPAVLLHTHPSTESRCTITHTPLGKISYPKTPFHLSAKMRRDWKKAAVPSHAQTTTLYHHTHEDDNANSN